MKDQLLIHVTDLGEYQGKIGFDMDNWEDETPVRHGQIYDIYLGILSTVSIQFISVCE